MKRILTLALLITTVCGIATAKEYSLTSPDGKLVVTISNGGSSQSKQCLQQGVERAYHEDAQ